MTQAADSQILKQAMLVNTSLCLIKHPCNQVYTNLKMNLFKFLGSQECLRHKEVKCGNIGKKSQGANDGKCQTNFL